MGCVSMLTHLRYSDSEIQSQADTVALVLTCAEKGVIGSGSAHALAHAITDLHSVSVFNKHLYEATYQAKRAQYRNSIPYPPRQSLEASRCAEFEESADAGISLMRRKYAEIAQARQRDLVGMGQSLSAFGSSSYSSSMYVPMPTNEVTFGQQQSRNVDHFLVNTGSGLRHCSVSSSGYVNCL